jgi:hypothetical protein
MRHALGRNKDFAGTDAMFLVPELHAKFPLQDVKHLILGAMKMQRR